MDTENLSGGGAHQPGTDGSNLLVLLEEYKTIWRQADRYIDQMTLINRVVPVTALGAIGYAFSQTPPVQVIFAIVPILLAFGAMWLLHAGLTWSFCIVGLVAVEKKVNGISMTSELMTWATANALTTAGATGDQLRIALERSPNTYDRFHVPYMRHLYLGFYTSVILVYILAAAACIYLWLNSLEGNVARALWLIGYGLSFLCVIALSLALSRYQSRVFQDVIKGN